MEQGPLKSRSARPAAWDAGAVPDEVYAQVERALASSESPVGIDAKHTHVLILHALERIEQRLGEVTGDSSVMSDWPPTGPEAEAEVRRQVRQVLDRTSAYAALKPNRRERLADGLTRMVTLAVGRRVEAADFPGFVAELIEGTFEAIVDASLKQMEAYADLVDDLTAAVHQFASEGASEPASAQRERLLATMVLMGVTRIDVRRRQVRARTILGGDDDDD